ncbi:MAG TPA: hypothetical protein VH253_19285 [Phycisphaerae bacterium]|nr:hypothetical protein [Phycisphaerae bacterium]
MMAKRVIAYGRGGGEAGEVSGWTWIVFGWMVLEFSVVVGCVMGVLPAEGAVARAVMGMCLMMPMGCVAAGCNLASHLVAEGRSRWLWVPVTSVGLSVMSPGVVYCVMWMAPAY